MQNDRTLLFAMPRMSTGTPAASCDVSLGFSWGGGSSYRAWHHRHSVGSGSFLWNLTSPVTEFSEVRAQWSTDMSLYIQVHAAGTDFLTCLIFRVQNPSQRTMNSWWAWGELATKKKIIQGPFSCKARFGCLSDDFGQHRIQGEKPIVCVNGPLLVGPFDLYAAVWHGQTIAFKRFLFLSNS